jgi:hypothetical protein
LIMDGDPDLGPLALERQRCYAEGPKHRSAAVIHGQPRSLPMPSEL